MGRTQKTVFLDENYIKKSDGTMRIKMSFSLRKMNGRRTMVIIYCCWGGHLKKRTMILGNCLAISFFFHSSFTCFVQLLFLFFLSFSFSLFLFSLFFLFFSKPLGGGGGDRPHRPPPSDPPLKLTIFLTFHIFGCIHDID